MAKLVECPMCAKSVNEDWINSHLDSHLSDRSNPTDQTSAPAVGGPSSSASTTAAAKRKPPVATGPSTKRFKPTPAASAALDSARPLPDRVRPSSLAEISGQDHILAPGTLVRSLIDRDALGSVVLWGGPGSGKTTIARCLANAGAGAGSVEKGKKAWREVSATGGGAGEVKKVLEEAEGALKLTGRRTVLFVDEIQRFNKAQQDLFLPYVEAGTITVILATTENPSFRINAALLSRCRVLVLNKLTPFDCESILRRAIALLRPDPDVEPLSDEVVNFLARVADGDARVALSSLELALAAVDEARREGRSLTDGEIKSALGKAHLQYDRNGDNHYDSISALHKSVRGSDADAALYWLARMLQAGEDPLYVARRIVRMASEDVGLANPAALHQCLAAYQATQLIGMPECDCILAQAVVMLCESPKSVRVYKAYGRAKACVAQEPAYPVPLHIRNAPTKLMKEIGYGREYRYEPGFGHPVYQPFLPRELDGTRFLHPEGEDPDLQAEDEEGLREWEEKRNGGRPWPGRKGAVDVREG